MLNNKAARCFSVLACGVLALSFGWASEPPIVPATQPIAKTPQAATPKPPAPVVERLFAIAPVTTDLQRRSFPYTTPPVAVVFLNESGIFRDSKTLDLNAIDFTSVEQKLDAYRPIKQNGVQFRHCCDGKVTSQEYRTGMELLKYGWEGLGLKVGFGWCKSDISVGGTPDAYSF